MQSDGYIECNEVNILDAISAMNEIKTGSLILCCLNLQLVPEQTCILLLIGKLDLHSFLLYQFQVTLETEG